MTPKSAAILEFAWFAASILASTIGGSRVFFAFAAKTSAAFAHSGSKRLQCPHHGA